MVEIAEIEHNKGKVITRNEDNLRDLWDNIKHINIITRGTLEEKYNIK